MQIWRRSSQNESPVSFQTSLYVCEWFVFVCVGGQGLVWRRRSQKRVSATHYNTLQHITTHCNTLQHTCQPWSHGACARENVCVDGQKTCHSLHQTLCNTLYLTLQHRSLHHTTSHPTSTSHCNMALHLTQQHSLNPNHTATSLSVSHNITLYYIYITLQHRSRHHTATSYSECTSHYNIALYITQHHTLHLHHTAASLSLNVHHTAT